jgi:hypothetical protein
MTMVSGCIEHASLCGGDAAVQVVDLINRLRMELGTDRHSTTIWSTQSETFFELRKLPMKAYSIDDYWDRLQLEYLAAKRREPWIDRAAYHLILGWLKWRIRRAVKGANP